MVYVNALNSKESGQGSRKRGFFLETPNPWWELWPLVQKVFPRTAGGLISGSWLRLIGTNSIEQKEVGSYELQ